MLEQSSPRQKAFLEDLARRGCKVVQVTYDRNACNAKELTVTRGEYLEVLNDSRNWWECRNVHSRSGFVPHTILSVLSLDDWEQEGGGMEEPGGKPAVHERKQRQIAAAESATSSAAVPAAGNGHQSFAGPSSSGSSTPELIRQRRGPKGEFRYF